MSLFHEITEVGAIYHTRILWRPLICEDSTTVISTKIKAYESSHFDNLQFINECLGGAHKVHLEHSLLHDSVTSRSKTNVLDVNSSHLDHLQGTELLPCDWVACLQPPQAPAYTHLRHTGWWGFKKLLKSEMIHICQVWRPHPIWRECQFCLWERNGFWGGLPSNILWSNMPG